MAGPLILMKLTVLRREASGPRSGWVLGGAAAGLALAAATIGAAMLRARSPGTVADLLGVVFAVWALGWMLGPAYTGQPVLRAEQFRLLPVPRRRLALGLLGAAFAGVTAPVTFIAFTALVVFGIRLGMVPALIALPAVVLQLILVVLLSRVTGSLFGALSRSRAGAVVSALLTAVMLVASSSGWIVLAALHPLVATGFPAGFAAAVRALPSSWAVLAVEASSRSDWLMTAAPLLGLIAVLLLLWLTWERSLGPARWPRPAVRGSPAGRAAPRHWMPAGATAAVLVKELRTWRRDPQRLNSLVVPPAFAVMTCLVPGRVRHDGIPAVPRRAHRADGGGHLGESLRPRRHRVVADAADTRQRASRCPRPAARLAGPVRPDDPGTHRSGHGGQRTPGPVAGGAGSDVRAARRRGRAAAGRGHRPASPRSRPTGPQERTAGRHR